MNLQCRYIVLFCRLCEAYRRMENPVCIEIDAKGSKESVVKTAEETLEKHGIKL